MIAVSRPLRSGFAGIQRTPTRVLVTLMLTGLAVSMLFPFYITIITAFKTLPDYQASTTAWPKHWTLQNFADAWGQAHVREYAKNSFIVTVIGLVLIVVTVTPAGFAFAKFKFRGRKLLLALILSLVIISPGLQIVPIFKLAKTYDMLNSYLGLATVYVSLSVSLGIYLMSAYFEGVPSEIFEAAAIDGAGPFRAFLRIGLPIARPGLLTVVTFAFLAYWNEYLFGLIMMLDGQKRTLPVGIASLRSMNFTSEPLLMAALVIAMVPCVFVFVLLQRNLNEGLTAGVSK